MKCSYRGFTFRNAIGDKLNCPVCDAQLKVMDRDGRAWIAAHEHKRPIHVMPYQFHTKGNKQ